MININMLYYYLVSTRAAACTTNSQLFSVDTDHVLNIMWSKHS